MQITGAGTQICCTSGDTWGTMAFLYPFPQLYISLDTIAERLAHSQAGAISYAARTCQLFVRLVVQKLRCPMSGPDLPDMRAHKSCWQNAKAQRQNFYCAVLGVVKRPGPAF